MRGHALVAWCLGGDLPFRRGGDAPVAAAGQVTLPAGFGEERPLDDPAVRGGIGTDLGRRRLREQDEREEKRGHFVGTVEVGGVPMEPVSGSMAIVRRQ